VHRLKVALALRERFYTAPFYRLVFGEADLLPGLVVDRYGDVLVGQIGTAALKPLKPEIEEALVKVVARRLCCGRTIRPCASSRASSGR
jgi:23S rRNA (cytosine1962-C5)-methyltransferase